ncbi:MAG: ATP-dependent DNA helicase [Hydrococcus sp. C42_A2020_068]|nr:ATP-dependent DNA helicase [Hydrococcus sp. C42_A2020_068]
MAPLLEAEVHSSLLSFLRGRGKSNWPHHLTMARIISRALRLQRSALIQTGSPVTQYCLSYLTPALLSDTPVLLVAPKSVQQHLLQVEIPQLQEWLQTHKEIRTVDRWLEGFGGLMLTSPQAWLADRLENLGRFPQNILTVIDRADDLEEWARECLSAAIEDWHWGDLVQSYPRHADFIRDVRVQLTKAIFARPKNPYGCYLIEDAETESLRRLLSTLAAQTSLIPSFERFWHRWPTKGQMMWASIDRDSGHFTLHVAPVEVASVLNQVWEQQPVVLIGSFLDSDKNASVYRQQLGLGDLLCLKFLPNRQNEYIQLYVPERFPLPNTPEFQGALMQEVRTLVSYCDRAKKLIVVLVEDVPLKARVGATIAAEFGSRVRVEKTAPAENGILVSGWQFWCDNQERFPAPQLLIVATLPIPSLENPLVAGRVAYYKRQRQDWFRLYLLPTALREIQRAVMPLRESQGIVTLLDNRINYRSYGDRVLTALEPYARINYLDPSWFDPKSV